MLCQCKQTISLYLYTDTQKKEYNKSHKIFQYFVYIADPCEYPADSSVQKCKYLEQTEH